MIKDYREIKFKQRPFVRLGSGFSTLPSLQTHKSRLCLFEYDQPSRAPSKPPLDVSMSSHPFKPQIRLHCLDLLLHKRLDRNHASICSSVQCQRVGWKSLPGTAKVDERIEAGVGSTVRKLATTGCDLQSQGPSEVLSVMLVKPVDTVRCQCYPSMLFLK